MAVVAVLMIGAVTPIWVPSAVAVSDPGPVFGLRPALAGQTLLAEGHFGFALPPRGRISDGVQAINFSADVITLDMYCANLMVSRTGGTGPGQPGDQPTGATRWIHLSRATLVVPPKGVQTDHFNVDVPEGTPPGDYLSTVVASLTAGPATPGGLSVQTRVALIVKVTVTGAIHPAVSAGHLTHHRMGGTERFEVAVTNRGNVVVDLAGTLDLPGGATVPFGPQGLYVIPGGHATLSADWQHLPTLSRSRVVAHLTATLDAHQVDSITRSVSILFVPWRLLTAAVALTTAVVAVAVLGRFRMRAWRRRHREERAIIAAHRARARSSTSGLPNRRNQTP